LPSRLRISFSYCIVAIFPLVKRKIKNTKSHSSSVSLNSRKFVVGRSWFRETTGDITRACSPTAVDKLPYVYARVNIHSREEISLTTHVEGLVGLSQLLIPTLNPRVSPWENSNLWEISSLGSSQTDTHDHHFW
jgi:hypothetical protein